MGFYAKATVRNPPYSIGDVIYLKLIQEKFTTKQPMLYAILDRRNGEQIGVINANQLRNHFEVKA